MIMLTAMRFYYTSPASSVTSNKAFMSRKWGRKMSEGLVTNWFNSWISSCKKLKLPKSLINLHPDNLPYISRSATLWWKEEFIDLTSIWMEFSTNHLLRMQEGKTISIWYIDNLHSMITSTLHHQYHKLCVNWVPWSGQCNFPYLFLFLYFLQLQHDLLSTSSNC